MLIRLIILSTLSRWTHIILQPKIRECTLCSGLSAAKAAKKKLTHGISSVSAAALSLKRRAHKSHRCGFTCECASELKASTATHQSSRRHLALHDQPFCLSRLAARSILSILGPAGLRRRQSRQSRRQQSNHKRWSRLGNWTTQPGRLLSQRTCTSVHQRAVAFSLPRQSSDKTCHV